MKKFMSISILSLGLAGCNATVYTQRPEIYASPIHALPPVAVYPRYAPAYPRARPAHFYGRPNCYSVWDRTPYGMRERRVCRGF